MPTPHDERDRPRPADGSPDELVTLLEATTEFEARSLVVVLEDAGIRAVAFGAGDLPSVPSLTTGRPRGVPVQVARGDFEAARTLVDELPVTAGAIDWDQVDVGEPVEEMRSRSFLSSPGFIRATIGVLVLGFLLAVAGVAIEVLSRSS